MRVYEEQSLRNESLHEIQNKTNQRRLPVVVQREKREIRFQNQTLLLLLLRKRNYLRSARVKTIHRAMWWCVKVVVHSPSVKPLSPFYGILLVLFLLSRVFVWRSDLLKPKGNTAPMCLGFYWYPKWIVFSLPLWYSFAFASSVEVKERDFCAPKPTTLLIQTTSIHRTTIHQTSTICFFCFFFS